MTTAVRKLENEDIRAIFESLHDNKPPPQGLDFKIVPVGSDGLRLSPPAHEYEDGIYVLLRPDKSKTTKKKKGSPNERGESPKIPPHLAHLEMKTPLSNDCPWSLSGPQFPKPTAIQQRYCYPQGNVEYASKKGGSMWTMYNRDGKEDDEYRLLHVYYSIKRANTSAKAKISSKSSKAQKKKNLPHKSMSTAVRKATFKKNRPVSKPTRRAVLPRSTCPPSSAARVNKNHIFRQSQKKASPGTAAASGCTNHSSSKQGSFDATFEGRMVHPVPSSLYNNEYSSLHSSKTNPHGRSKNPFSESQPYQEVRNESPPDLAREFDTMLGVPLADPSSMIKKEPHTEWSTLMGANDTKDLPLSDFHEAERYPEILMHKLQALHKNIIDRWIDSRPRSERGRLVSVVANWAQSISQSPLEILISSEDETEKLDLGANSEDWDIAIEV